MTTTTSINNHEQCCLDNAFEWIRETFWSICQKINKVFNDFLDWCVNLCACESYEDKNRGIEMEAWQASNSELHDRVHKLMSENTSLETENEDLEIARKNAEERWNDLLEKYQKEVYEKLTFKSLCDKAQGSQNELDNLQEMHNAQKKRLSELSGEIDFLKQQNQRLQSDNELIETNLNEVLENLKLGALEKLTLEKSIANISYETPVDDSGYDADFT